MASIGDVEIIDPKSATKLRKAGIRTTEGLLRRAATRKGRHELAAEAGLDAAALLVWVNRADLMRVKGVGAEYAELLAAAGIATTSQLKRRNSTTLTAQMIDINERKNLVSRMPTEGMVSGWISSAGELNSLVRR